jgi:RimJ/RimL family protein N-acetyltransferase
MALLRRIAPTDAAACRTVRLRGLRECPSGFGSSYSTESKQALETFAQRWETSSDTWTFGAFDDDRLVAIVTLRRFLNAKERHKAEFVSRSHRKKGVGRLLLTRAIKQAQRMRDVQKLLLRVNEANQPARSLYESLGFSGNAREENATLVGGEFHHELLMVRPL